VISFSEAQIVAWISPILWPFLRILAMFSVAPVYSVRSIPMRAKIGLAFLVALSAQAVLVDQPMISVNSSQALGAVLQQVGVGLAIGFAARLVFGCVELAGELIGLQMGLSFASFFDPMTNRQSSAVSSFMGNIATLLFVVINGHLMLLMAVMGQGPLTLALAVAITILLGQQLRCLHPPAGGLAFLVVYLGVPWGFLVFPVLTGSVLLVLMAWGFSRWVPGAATYPRHWL